MNNIIIAVILAFLSGGCSGHGNQKAALIYGVSAVYFTVCAIGAVQGG